MEVPIVQVTSFSFQPQYVNICTFNQKIYAFSIPLQQIRFASILFCNRMGFCVFLWRASTTSLHQILLAVFWKTENIRLERVNNCEKKYCTFQLPNLPSLKNNPQSEHQKKLINFEFVINDKILHFGAGMPRQPFDTSLPSSFSAWPSSWWTASMRWETHDLLHDGQLWWGERPMSF